MRANWPLRTLEDLCARITSGGTPNRSRPDYYGGLIPWIKTGELLDRVIVDSEEHLTELGLANSSAKLLPRGTILMAMYGATVGALGHLGSEATCNQASCAMVVDPLKANDRWLFYALLNDRRSITRKATGAAQQNLSGATIKRFAYSTPPLPEQQAIAEVLGALDDKIAANTRLAATATEALEIEAELRWFRRPGPTAPLTNFVDVAPQTPKPSSDEPTYVDMRALPERGMTIGSWTTRAPKGGARFANGDTLVARITPCLENRKTGYVDFLDDGEVAVGSTEFIVLRPQPGVAGPIGYFLAVGSEFRSFAIQHMVGSSGRQRVAAADVAQFEIPEPDHDWLAEFNSRATSTFDHLRSMAAENRTLAATRDALLPQLMSGKIRVRDIEGVAEEAGV